MRNQRKGDVRASAMARPAQPPQTKAMADRISVACMPLRICRTSMDEKSRIMTSPHFTGYEKQARSMILKIVERIVAIMK